MSEAVDIALDFLVDHPLGSWIGYGLLSLAAVLILTLMDGRTVMPPEVLRRDGMSRGPFISRGKVWRFDRVGEGGRRPAGDPGPKHIGGEVEPNSGISRPT